MKITATELNKRPGSYLTEAMRSPVIIEKTGKPAVVMVAYDRYLELEDTYWGELAIKAAKEQSLSTEDSIDFLHSND